MFASEPSWPTLRRGNADNQSGIPARTRTASRARAAVAAESPRSPPRPGAGEKVHNPVRTMPLPELKGCCHSLESSIADAGAAPIPQRPVGDRLPGQNYWCPYIETKNKQALGRTRRLGNAQAAFPAWWDATDRP